MKCDEISGKSLTILGVAIQPHLPQTDTRRLLRDSCSISCSFVAIAVAEHARYTIAINLLVSRMRTV